MTAISQFGVRLSGTPLPMIASTPADDGMLAVPDEFRDKLKAAMKKGRANAAIFAKTHNASEKWMVKDWALSRLEYAPKEDAEDLAYLHRVAATRTPEGVARAQHLAKHGLTDEWENMLREYTSAVGPKQARQAEKLLHDALMMVNSITQTAKASNNRQRPFVVDPTLELVVDRPGNNPSFPSGHTSAAVAGNLVLAHLMPDRREEFLGKAFESGWARVYSGVHFPTDVVAGAHLATTVVTELIRTSNVRPKRGTKQHSGSGSHNSGVVGTRPQVLPNAVRLTGTPLPELAAAAS